MFGLQCSDAYRPHPDFDRRLRAHLGVVAGRATHEKKATGLDGGLADGDRDDADRWGIAICGIWY